MKSEKYSNGMYKTTSKAQNTASQSIFRTMAENPTGRGLESMGMDFNQVSGNCQYDFYFPDFKTVYYVLINREGQIIESGYTTR